LFASRDWELGDEKLDRFGNEKYDGLGCDVREEELERKEGKYKRVLSLF
jgi:hypothetical protein